ncbi:hypothetical protein C8R43DRAFT_17192 [Mycena crocata]|nr:hypothetical protein C8R43DRAFT_17192 [Mycena crocata]
MPSVGPSILPALKTSKTRRIALHMLGVFKREKIDLAHPLFASVTHLDLFDTIEMLNSKEFPWSDLHRLDNLTHLAVFGLNDGNLASKLLHQCRDLQVLVSMYSEMTERTDNMRDMLSIDDVRVVVLEDDEYEADWVAGTKGGLPDVRAKLTCAPSGVPNLAWRAGRACAGVDLCMRPLTANLLTVRNCSRTSYLRPLSTHNNSQDLSTCRRCSSTLLIASKGRDRRRHRRSAFESPCVPWIPSFQGVLTV